MLEVAGFAAFALTASATPGPNNVLLTALGASVGIRRGLPVLFGIAFGFSAMIFLLAIGVGEAFSQIGPRTGFIMKLCGLAILFWLAWQIACAPVEEETDRPDARPLPRTASFLGAALFQWVNPKAWIICASAITAYFDSSRPLLAQATLLALTFVLAGLIGCLPWLAAGTLVGRYLSGQRARAFNIGMAGLLILSVTPMLLWSWF